MSYPSQEVVWHHSYCRWHSMTSLNTRTHAGVVHPLKGKGGSYPLEVVPLLWLRTSSFRSLSGKAHGQL